MFSGSVVAALVKLYFSAFRSGFKLCIELSNSTFDKIFVRLFISYSDQIAIDRLSFKSLAPFRIISTDNSPIETCLDVPRII